MNAHKKMKELGFRKTAFHKPGYDPTTYVSCMLPDNEEIKHEYKDGKYISTKFEKKHPKSNSFWVLKYSDIYTLWASVQNHDISMIWLENKSAKSIPLRYGYGQKNGDERLKLIYNSSDKDHFKIEGKDQIINLLPKEVRRDYLLEQLFGK
jgi:hypothetical protein